jgi:hypothetical protein
MLEVNISSPYLMSTPNSELSTKTLKGKGWGRVGKASPVGWAHLYRSANHETTNRKRESMRKGEEGV